MRPALFLAAALATTTVPSAAAATTPAAFEASVASTKQLMVADPGQALRGSDALIAAAKGLPDRRSALIGEATGEWLRGEALIWLNRAEEAKPVIARALAIVSQAAPNSKLHGDVTRSSGAISAIAGLIQPALADYQRAHDIFVRAGEPRSQSIILQDIGSIYLDAADYPRALDYFAQASEAYDQDPALLVTTHNNRALAFQELKRLREAEGEYRAALAAARELGSLGLQARILTNLSSALADAGKLDEAMADVRRGLAISQRDEDAAAWRPALYGIAAKVAAKRGDEIGAARLLDRTFAGVDLATTPMRYRELHQLAADIYAAVGHDDLALHHLRAYKRLDDEGKAVIASASSQLMAARFDFANQNAKISTLKAGQLERDIKLERSRARLTSLIAGVAVVILLLLTFGYVSIRRSRNEVRSANDGLSSANAALGRALQAKTEFLATTSHEIRTPLNGILGMTQVLLADRAIDAAVRDKVELVHGAGETMRALVDDILDVAKIETGELTIELGEAPLGQLLDETYRLWEGRATGKGLAIELDVAADVPAAILSDATRLRQIVFNLMSNAIKFTDAGSVLLAARVVQAGDGTERLRIDVVDTGIGIEEDHHEIIFEAFKQIDGGTTRKFGGTGLGLAICRNLSRALGGDVTVVSQPDRGSTFTLDVPLERIEPTAPVAVAAAERPTALEHAAVAMIEPNPLTQGILRAFLAPAVRTLGFVTDASRVEPQADLVVGDVRAILAEGGEAALAALIATAAANGARIVLLVPPGDADAGAAAEAAGADRVLHKPLAAPALLAALRATLTAGAAPSEAAA